VKLTEEKGMTGVSGSWSASTAIAAPATAVCDAIERLMSPRTYPPSDSFHAQRGAMVRRSRQANEFTLRYIWQHVCFEIRITPQDAPGGRTGLTMLVQPERSNSFLLYASSLVFGAWIGFLTASIAAGSAAGVSMGLWSWSLGRMAARRAMSTALEFLARVESESTKGFPQQRPHHTEAPEGALCRRPPAPSSSPR
jgi:hypothetical protein